MKVYQKPELNIMLIAEIGDVISLSFNESNARLGNIGTLGEDGGDFRID